MDTSIANAGTVGLGQITDRTTGSGLASQVLYSGSVAWVFGGQGVYDFQGVQPKRDIPDDSQIRQAAPVGSMCMINASPVDGTLSLYVFDEIYDYTDC